MSRNGTGLYTLPPLFNPVVDGTTITSLWGNTTLEDLAAAMTDSISASGQTPITANLPMSGFHHTGVSDPTARSQYVTLGMAQDGRQIRLTVSQGGNNIVGSVVGSMQGVSNYFAGMFITFFIPALAPTGAMTIQVNALPQVSLVNNLQAPIVNGDLQTGDFVICYFDGTKFVMISDVTSTATSGNSSASTTGWLLPAGGVYPLLTIASGTTVTIPAGDGIIVPPGQAGGTTTTRVSWITQTITVANVATAFNTFFCADSTGAIIQVPTILSQSQRRDLIVLGLACHPAGAVTDIYTTPAIFGDDGYKFTDVTNPLIGMLIGGGRVTSPSNNLNLTISAGLVNFPGGNPSDLTSPNTLPITAASNIQFRPLAGQNTLGAATATAPVGFYDPNGAGVVTALGAGNSAIHRLYWLAGEYFWVYGQTLYADNAVALARLLVDRGSFAPSSRMADATLIAEIIELGNASNLNAGFIIQFGSQNYAVGSAGGIADAPNDGQTYGRKNLAWSPVLSASTPSFTGDVIITKSQPRVKEVFNPIGAGWAGLQTQQAAGFDWFNIETTFPDDKTYFRSYNPATGALRFTTIYDLATGVWTFPAQPVLPGGVTVGNVTGPASALDNQLALYDGITGKLIKAGGVVGTAATANLQTTPTGTGVLTTGAFGLGTTGALNTPSGTTAQRPSATGGELRYNNQTNGMEWYNPVTGWTALSSGGATVVATGGITGLDCSVPSFSGGTAPVASKGMAFPPGTANDSTAKFSATNATTYYKRPDVTWVAGTGTLAAPVGGFCVGISFTTNTWYRGFMFWSASNPTPNFGFDISSTATNLLNNTPLITAAYGAASQMYYRQVSWMFWTTTAGGYIIPQYAIGDNVYITDEARDYSASPGVGAGTVITLTAPPLTKAKLTVKLALSVAATVYGMVDAVGAYLNFTGLGNTKATAGPNYLVVQSQLTTDNSVVSNVFVDVDANSQVRASVSIATNTPQLTIFTLGYIYVR